MYSSVCAAPGAALSHRVYGLAACPWRLYYTCYYTAAAISRQSQPATPIQRATISGHSPSRTRAARVWPCANHSPGPYKPMPMRPAAQIESEREASRFISSSWTAISADSGRCGLFGLCARYACGRLSRGRRASGGGSAGSSLKGRPATSGASATGRTRSGYRSHRPDGQTRCP
jgi:hypothetical protein